MKKIRKDGFVLIILILTSVFLYLKALDFPKGADTFPKFLLIVILLLSIIELAKKLFKNKVDTKSEDSKQKNLTFKDSLNPYIAFISAVVVALLIKIIGFFTATALFIAFLMWYFGVRKIKTYIISILAISGFIYVLFVMQLNVPLPKGLLF